MTIRCSSEARCTGTGTLSECTLLHSTIALGFRRCSETLHLAVSTWNLNTLTLICFSLTQPLKHETLALRLSEL